MVIVITGIVSYQLKSMQLHASAISGRIVVQPAYSGEAYPPSTIDLTEDEFDKIAAMNLFQTKMSSPVLFYTMEPPEYPTGPPMKLLVGLRKECIKSITGDAANETKVVEGVLKLENEYDVILGNQIFGKLKAENKELGIGSQLDIMDKTFKIVGVLDESVDKLVDNSMIVDIETAQKMFAKENYASAFILFPKDLDQVKEITDKIKGLGKKYSLITYFPRVEFSEFFNFRGVALKTAV